MTYGDTPLCSFCGQDYDPKRGVDTCCGEGCYRAYKRMQKQLADDGNLPPDRPENGYGWNGRTQYSDPGPLRFAYARKCSMCGRHPEIEWLTEARARLIGIAGLPPCFFCNGWVFMELQEVGGMGSPQRAAPARTVAEPVRPLKHHAA